MSTRLYYEDCYLREFEAGVLERRTVGGRPALVLDQTAFYPASGGQPHDTGRLGGARVLEVLEEESGVVLHVLETVPPEGALRGIIDWERRFDHMQQHTGQHILSQAFIRAAGADTLSFHLGQESCSIDIAAADPARAALRDAEELANRIVFESRPVAIRTVGREELAALDLRKETQREGPVRVVEVGGFDRSPCGGTHVRRTSEVGIILVLGAERYKGGTRVEFVCGGRALRTMRREHETLREAGRIASTHPLELPKLLERLLEERAALARDNSRMKEELLAAEAASLAAAASRVAGVALVRRACAGRSMEDLKLLARKVAETGRAIALLSLEGETTQVVAARSPGVHGDCAAAIKEAVGRFGGRGGGRPELAQAGGIRPESAGACLDLLENHFAREIARAEESP